MNSKKVLFSLPFLLFYIMSVIILNPLLKNPYLVLSFSTSDAIHVILLSIFIFLCSVSFVVFIALTQDIEYVLPLALGASLCSVFITSIPQNVIFFTGSLLIFSSIYYFLKKTLALYFNFVPKVLLGPCAKNTTTFLILLFSIGLYVVQNRQIQQQGFTVPDFLVTGISKMSMSQMQNYTPDAVSKLNSFGKLPLSSLISQSVEQETTKVIKSGIQNAVRPYEKFVPFVLAFLFFVSIKSIVMLFELFLGLFLNTIFWMLDKAKITKYEVQKRETRILVS